jgi:hypothetical protein
MLTTPNSAFFSRLQGDGLLIAEIIDLECRDGTKYHWTSANGEVTYTLSGAPTKYTPFPGQGDGVEEDMNLGVTVVNFVLANSGAPLQNQLLTQDFALAQIKLGYIFTDTPNLGRMDFYQGKIGDFVYDRSQITGQARNIWKSMNVQWPYYTYGQNCGWRFGSAGCGFDTSSITLHISSLNVASSNLQVLLLNSGTLSNSYNDGDFNFGRCTITGGVNSGTVRSIMSQVGDEITLSSPLSQPSLTSIAIDIFPGCQKRLLQDCHSRYNNDKNFLGWPWMGTYESAF